MKLKRNNRELSHHARALRQFFVFLLITGFLATSCKENDDLPPVMTLNGPDTVYHVLNEVYADAGVTAIDDTDGDLTSNVFVDNQVDIDRMGEYSVTYSVVDKSGNEAPTLSRVVYVFNEGLEYYGNYSAQDNEIFPQTAQCNYPSYIWVDSVVNNRLVFLDFACNSQREVFADVYDSVIILPFQLIQDSVYNMSLQGAGFITDSAVSFQYTKIESGVTSYWNSLFTRSK
jgi:hypothetical protein